METSNGFYGPVALYQQETADYKPHKRVGKTHRLTIMQMQGIKNLFSESPVRSLFSVGTVIPRLYLF